MFFTMTTEQHEMLTKLPGALSAYQAEHRGIRFTMIRKNYGMTLIRMNAVSNKTGMAFSLSIGLAESTKFSRPELRVDFVQTWERVPGSKKGRWASPFDPKNATHVAVMKWAAEAVCLHVAQWAPEVVPAQPVATSPKQVVIKQRQGCTYHNRQGTLVTRRSHPARVYQNAPLTAAN